MRAETVHILAWRLFDYRGEALTYGGAQRWLLELVRLLASRGHEVVVHQRKERSEQARITRRQIGHGILRGPPARAERRHTLWLRT